MMTNDESCYQNTITIETGLSDHHKMTISVLKTSYTKKAPIKVSYRCYKKFDEVRFKADLNYNLLHKSILDYHVFKGIFMNVLNHHLPVKEKLVRGNHQPFMNKTLSQAFMHRSKLKNMYNKFPTKENEINFKKQRNFCTALLKDKTEQKKTD